MTVVTGVCRGPYGEPLADIQVTFTDGEMNQYDADSSTAIDGAYSATVPEGDYGISAAGESYNMALPVAVTVGGATMSQDLSLVCAGGTLLIHAVSDGRPVMGASISVTLLAPETATWAGTSIVSAPNGDAQLQIYYNVYQYQFSCNGMEPVSIAFTDGDPLELMLSLSSGFAPARQSTVLSRGTPARGQFNSVVLDNPDAVIEY